jgi:DNA (cytosine-5)-methyltransferase 1
MPWLTPSDNEVTRFHPEFEAAAIEALSKSGLDSEFKWYHHLRGPGSPLVPDFVLVRQTSGHWVLALEIKRSQEAVFSTRFQLQAKGYAETNQDRYSASGPKFFALSNLETTLVFALDGGHPPQECLLRQGTLNSGTFSLTPQKEHRTQFIADLTQIIQLVHAGSPPVFERVWPGVIRAFEAAARSLTYAKFLDVCEPSSPSWDLVRNYFGWPLPEHSTYTYLFRCLICEYLRGILVRHGHPQADKVPPLTVGNPASVAQAISVLRTIDFDRVFDPSFDKQYRNIADAKLTSELNAFLGLITDPSARIFDLAKTRPDAPQLVESLFDARCPVPDQDDFGKVQTDPELARILAALTMTSPTNRALDPGCGEGSLLSAAFDQLVRQGHSPENAANGLTGIDADGIAVRIAALKIALKNPAALKASTTPNVLYGDLFAMPSEIAKADVVLMNPPFKRYEAQDRRPMPKELRRYFQSAIKSIDGKPAEAAGGQANLYNLYVEFVCKAAKAGTLLGLILDNKWYHNSYGKALRAFLLRHCEIILLLEYPHSAFFENWMIATSLIVLRKTTKHDINHQVSFVRSKVDPRSFDLQELNKAGKGEGAWPSECFVRSVPQKDLSPKVGWKTYFQNPLKNDFLGSDWPNLEELFEGVRRGSLQKEGGGLDILEFPFNRNIYGHRRGPGTGKRFVTSEGRRLTQAENARLAKLAKAIPLSLRGYALKNAPDLSSYEITTADATRNQTFEPPYSRKQSHLFRGEKRADWSGQLRSVLAELQCNAAARAYIRAVKKISNLSEALLPKEQLWVVLREPYAGELIVPRKMRGGHRVHVNPFAFSSTSLVGRRVVGDPRGMLVFRFVEIIAAKRPAAFVMENVPGMAASKVNGQRLPDHLIEQFSELGYHVAKASLSATNFLVPQLRRRLFLIGSLYGMPTPLDPVRFAREKYGVQFGAFDLSARAAIGDLGGCSSKGNRVRYTAEEPSEFAKIMRRCAGDDVSLHECPRMSDTDKMLAAIVPPGGNYRDVPDEVATGRIKKFKATGGRTTTYGKLHPARPAFTINTYFRRPNVGCNLHYSEPRLITAREAMRFQAIPDHFEIVYSSNDQRNGLIGNAVPPLMAQAVACKVREILQGERRVHFVRSPPPKQHVLLKT